MSAPGVEAGVDLCTASVCDHDRAADRHRLTAGRPKASVVYGASIDTSAMHLPQVTIAGLMCAVLTAALQPAALPAALDVLPPLHGEAVTYDEARDRLVVFGGRTPDDWLQGTWE